MNDSPSRPVTLVPVNYVHDLSSRYFRVLDSIYNSRHAQPYSASLIEELANECSLLSQIKARLSSRLGSHISSLQQKDPVPDFVDIQNRKLLANCFTKEIDSSQSLAPISQQENRPKRLNTLSTCCSSNTPKSASSENTRDTLIDFIQNNNNKASHNPTTGSNFRTFARKNSNKRENAAKLLEVTKICPKETVEWIERLVRENEELRRRENEYRSKIRRLSDSKILQIRQGDSQKSFMELSSTVTIEEESKPKLINISKISSLYQKQKMLADMEKRILVKQKMLRDRETLLAHKWTNFEVQKKAQEEERQYLDGIWDKLSKEICQSHPTVFEIQGIKYWNNQLFERRRSSLLTQRQCLQAEAREHEFAYERLRKILEIPLSG